MTPRNDRKGGARGRGRGARVPPRCGGASAGHLLGFTVTIPTFPGIGDAWLVGALFLAHIAIAEFSVGAITLAVAMEGYGLRSGNAFARRYARAAANSYYGPVLGSVSLAAK